MSNIEHAKKHNINDEKNHIKNDLDINGNFTIPFNKQIVLGRGSSYELNSYLKWDNFNHRFLFGKSLELQGSLYLQGESTIFGGELTNDSITIRGSRTANFPQIYIEGNTSTGYIIENGSNQYFNVSMSGLTPTTLLKIDKDYLYLHLPIYTPTYIKNSLTIGDVGNNHYSYFDTDGYLKMFGNARVWKSLKHYGYNLYGFSSTYNGVSTDATSLAVLGSQYVTQQFKKKGFGANPSSFITTFVMPNDYEANEEINIILNWCNEDTSGNVHYGVGIAPLKEGDAYNTPNYTYVVGDYAVNSVAYGKVQTEFTFSSPLINSGDELGVVVYRDIDNVGDTSSGNSYISSVVLKYVANKIGEKVV